MDDDNLEALLQADEAAIADKGFSKTVVRAAAGESNVRQLALFAAAGAGSAFALSGLTRLAEHAPKLSDFNAWFGETLVRIETPAFVGEVSVHPVVMLALVAAFSFAIAIPVLTAQRD